MEFVENVVRDVVTSIQCSVAVQGVASIPSNILRNDDGTPIRNDDGEYIYTS